ERSMSTKTGFAPHKTTVEAVAKNVKGGITTSWPGPMPWASNATWRAAVPFATAIACFRPKSFAKAFSNASTFGPWASIPDAMTSRTAVTSSSPRIGRAIGIIEARNRLPTMKVRRSLPPAGTSSARRVFQLWERLAVMGASHVPIEGTTAFAHPTDEFRGDACDQTVRGDILCDDGPSRNHRVPTDRDPTDDCGVRAERDTVLNLRLHPAPVWADRSRVKIIRKTDVGTDEDTVADRDSPVDRREILHFAIVPNQHLGIDVDILSDDTILANSGSLPDLRPMPNAAPFSDLCLRGDLRGRMNLRSHGTPQPSSRFKYVSGWRA